MRNALAIAIALAVGGTLSIACTALSGADGLGQPNDDIPLRERRYADGDGGAGSSGTSSSGASRRDPSGEPRGGGGGPSSSSGDSGTSSIPPSESDAGFDANTTAPAGFIDNFGRADSPTIGNGWSEKQDHFSLLGGTVLQTGFGSYVDWIVRRPTSENGLDVQLSVDFTVASDPDCDPTLYARMQPNSDELRVLTGYTFYAFTDFAGIDREDGETTKDLAGTQIAPPLAVGQTYRYVFRVTGTNPVRLEAMITTLDGKTTLATVTTNDGDPRRIITAGQVGFGSGYAAGGRWDNFRRTDL